MFDAIDDARREAIDFLLWMEHDSIGFAAGRFVYPPEPEAYDLASAAWDRAHTQVISDGDEGDMPEWLVAAALLLDGWTP